MTLEQLYRQGSERLSQSGVENASVDGRYLLMEVFGMTLASLLAVKDQELPENEETGERCRRYKELIEKRAMRIPLQYLIGIQSFMGYDFYVNEHVLIPRQDTETLVELALKENPSGECSLLDVCTGSGCIAISLALKGGYRQVTALDLSEEALKVAGRNAEALLGDDKGCVTLVKSDMFESLPQGSKFDLIVSNPPYIRSSVIDRLEPEVSWHEPRMALDGAEDGLKFYRILAKKCKDYLKPGGCVYVEIGYDQRLQVEALFQAQGYERIRTVKDMAGQDRVVRADWIGQQQE